MKILILISLTGLLIACGNPTKKNETDKLIRDLSDSVNVEKPEIIEQVQNADYLKIVGDSVEIPFFEIELKLSEKAEKKLKADNETVIVMAYFLEIIRKDDYFDERPLTSHSIELTDKRLARFENIKFSKDLYDSLENKDIELLINVFSGRRSTENNILDCDLLQDFMSNIKEKRFTLTGKLIFGDD